MHNYPNIVTVNTRKVKKAAKAIGLLHDITAIKIAESYRGKFVVVTQGEDGQYVAVQYAPNTPNHSRTRNIPHQFTRRIKNNKEFA